jgi:hypothetical protein
MQVMPKDPAFYGNERQVEDVRLDLEEDVGFPLSSNLVSRRQLSQITRLPEVYSVRPFLVQVRNPLEYFELDDTHLYTGDTVVSEVINGFLLEWDPDLPLLDNILPHGVASDVAGQLDLWVTILITTVNALDTVHPFERQIDLALATPDFIARETVRRLPIGSNLCGSTALADILECITSDRDPLIVPLPPTDAISLIVYEAPEECEEDVANLVNLLMGMVLAMDVLPFVPILEDIHGDEMGIVINALVNESVVAVRGEEINHFAIEKITTVGGLAERPVLITPEDVLGMLLWETVLPEMPLRLREIEEMIADELDDQLDEFNIDASDLDAEEEAFTEKIERMVTYVPRKRIKAD